MCLDINLDEAGSINCVIGGRIKDEALQSGDVFIVVFSSLDMLMKSCGVTIVGMSILGDSSMVFGI